MKEASGVHLVTLNGVKLPIRSYRFETADGHSMFFTVTGTAAHRTSTMPLQFQKTGPRAAGYMRPGRESVNSAPHAGVSRVGAG